MKKEDFAKLARRHGFRVYQRGRETQLAPCPNCGNDPGTHGNWSAQVSGGKFNAWCCEASGRLDQFIEKYFGQDDVYIPVEEDDHYTRQDTRTLDLRESNLVTALDVPSAKNYLRKRGVTTGQVIRHQLSVYTSKDHPEYGDRLFGRLIVPVADYWSGETFGFVARTLRDQYPKYLNVFPEKQIAGFRSTGRQGIHVLVEGVFDGLAAERVGFQAAVTFGQVHNSLKDWATNAPEEEKFLVAFDGDSLYYAERKIAARLREVRETSVVELPEDEDPASVGDERLRELIEGEL